jgi:hypothetical protein
MAKTREAVVELPKLPSGLTFEQAKVHFIYAFYLNGWRRLARDFSKSDLWRESWGRNDEHRQLAWIARQLGFRNPALRLVNVHEADETGTRPFLRRLDPFVQIDLAAQSLQPSNWKVMPELAEVTEAAGIRVTPSLRLYYSGFGVLCLRTNFLTAKGRELAVREIVYSADDSARPPLKPFQADHLIKKLIELLTDHPHELPRQVLADQLKSLDDPRKQRCIGDRIAAVADQRTPVTQPLGPMSVIQISNLDRGISRLHQPAFTWDGRPEQPLYGYFTHVINDLIAKPISEGLERGGVKLTQPLALCDRWHAEQGQHPYVSIFLPQYGDPKGGAEHGAVAAAFNAHVEAHQEELARILLRTSWHHVRREWPPIREAMENVFYSDLLHISIHLRGALCHYYLPSSFKGFDRLPELRNSYKYREELSNIIAGQRLLWYAYNMFDHEAGRQIQDLSRKFDELSDLLHVKQANTHMVLRLQERIQAIDEFKTEVARTMVDPQSRKGGSSLFTEILDRTTSAFHLPELYANLRHKLDRLDMLGLHSIEALHGRSQLQVAEGTRSTQLTLEFLEALIIAYYAASMWKYLDPKFVQILTGQADKGLVAQLMLMMIFVGAFLTALPWIMMIRKSFAQFELPEPQWLERFQAFGALVGPGVLAALASLKLYAYFTTNGLTAWPVLPYIALVFLAYATVAGGWWVLDKGHQRQAEGRLTAGAADRCD